MSLNYYKLHTMALWVRNGVLGPEPPPGNYWPTFPDPMDWDQEIRDNMPFSLLNPIPANPPVNPIELGKFERVKLFGRAAIGQEKIDGDYQRQLPYYNAGFMDSLTGPTGALVWINTVLFSKWNGFIRSHEATNSTQDSSVMWQKQRATWENAANGFFAKANIWANWQGAHGWKPTDSGTIIDFQTDKITIEDVQLINTFTAPAMSATFTDFPWEFQGVPFGYHDGLIGMVVICIPYETPAVWSARTGIPIS